MAAGWAAGTGRAIVAAIGRPMGRGPGTPGRVMAGAAERWGMVMSSSPGLAHVVAPASPPATEHSCADTERKGLTGLERWLNRTGGPVRPRQNYTYGRPQNCCPARFATRSPADDRQCWRRVDMSANVPRSPPHGPHSPHGSLA